MAGIEDLLKGNVLTGLAIGIGVVIVAPVVLPIVAGIGRPLAKSAIKGGLILFDKARESTAELGEVFDDLVAEARAELHGSAAADVVPGSPEAASAASNPESPPREPSA